MANPARDAEAHLNAARCGVRTWCLLQGSQLQSNVHAGAVLEAGFSRLKLQCDEYINHARVSELVNAKRQGSLSL